MSNSLDGSLWGVPLHDLERLQQAVVRGGVLVPITEVGLRAENLHRFLDHMDMLACFPTPQSLGALLELIIAGRRRIVETPKPQVVWTGPEPSGSRARLTSVVVQDLFEEAKSEVFIAGYAFDKSEDVLRPLHKVMQNRVVETRIVLDCSRHEVHEDTPPDAILTAVVAAFYDSAWIFGDPKPALFYDPRTLERTPSWGDRPQFPEVSMHAKCIVVDRRHVLVGSANFTERAHTRNIEVGVLLTDETFADGLLYQWQAAMSQGMVLPVIERYATTGCSDSSSGSQRP